MFSLKRVNLHFLTDTVSNFINFGWYILNILQVLLIFALRTVHKIMCAKVKKSLLFLLLLQKFIEYLKSRYNEIEQRYKYGELIYQIF